VLSLRRPYGTSFVRASGFNKENFDNFFEILDEEYEKHQYPPDRIFSVDETGLTAVQSKVIDVIARKGKRQIASLTSAERGGLMTVIVAMSASGQFIPPLITFRERI
jgi:hypothetical protein